MKNAMKRSFLQRTILRVMLMTCLLSLSAGSAWATHIVGGVMSYDCLNYNSATQMMTLRLNMWVYRDAINGQAPFDNPAWVGIYAGNNTATPYTTVGMTNPVIRTLPVVLSNPCLAVPPNVRVEEAVYATTITLPYNAAGYHLSYQRCCRNGTINNLINPGDVGATYTIFLSGAAMQACNSSPRFRNFPPIAICRGEDLNFDHSATDANGHRLEYELCTPIDGGTPAAPAPNPPPGPPYANVPFSAGFSPTYPMTTSPAISINRTTGRLTGVPTQLGQFVVGVCVLEFNAQGVLLSRTMRDFQFNVSRCENQVTALLQADSVSPDSNRFYFRRCAQTSLSFVNQSRQTSAISGYRWQFSNGASSTATNPSINFGTGTFTGTLVANPGNAICTDTAFIFVELQPNPVANFSVAIDSCNPARPPVQLTSTSTVPAPYSIHTYQWNLGNGQTSTQANPQATYTAPGTYTIQLTVQSGRNCLATTSRTIQYYPPATAAYTASPQQGCAPLQTQFTNTSSFTMTGYTSTWDFGDGSPPSTVAAPSRTYTVPNVYNSTLTVRSPWGCLSTATRPINAFEPPTAAFGVSYDSCVVDTVVATNLSTPNQAGTNIVNWQWAMGDGAGYASPNAAHLYTLANTYPIQLIVTDANGCRDTAQRPIQWYPAPIISVTHPTTGCAPLPVAFNNQSYPINGYTTAWNFGNGQTSLQASPTTSYANAGSYPVQLLITSPVGCTASYASIIQVNASPNAAFTTVYDTCVVAPVLFDEQATPNAAGTPLTAWQWNFGNNTGVHLARDTAYQYPAAGDYNVQLVVTDANGCRDTLTRLLRYQPAPIVAVATSDDEICQFQSINFLNSSSPVNAAYTYAWQFGDGTSSNAISPSHQYTQFGRFVVTLQMTSPIGCRSNFRDTVQVHQIPNADFTVQYDSCSYIGVQLTNTSQANAAGNALTNWIWSFGDGGTATNVNDTVYPYAPRQNYPIALYLEDVNGCRDTTTYLLNYFPSPVFPVPSHSLVGCAPQTVAFSNNPLNDYPGYAFNWNLGGGVQTNAFDTTLTYTQRGTYYATLTVTTATGCVDVFRDTIVVNGLPTAIASFSYDSCALDPVTFRNRSTASPDGAINQINWSFGDGGTSTQPLAYYSYTYPDTGVYDVQLVVTDVNGCQDDTTIQIHWRPYPVFPLAFAPSTGCVPHLVPTPAPNPYPIANYTTLWNWGNGQTSTQGAPADFVYTQAGTYTRQLIVIAPNGCRDTFSSQHTALEVPVADFTFAPNPITHTNPTVQFTDQSTNAAQWEWHFGLNRIPDYRYAQNPSFTYRDTGVFVAQLVVTHLNGCTDTIAKPVDIVPQFTFFLPNAFTPNMDGRNDGFRGNGILQYISEFEMQIFNRWGEMIFTTNSPTEAWNGRKFNTGELCQSGVYVVQVRLRGPRGEKEEIKGFATLIY